MQLKMFEKFKKNCVKKWKRITASRITKLFIVFSVLQTIAVIILQIKVMVRNLEFLYFTFETTDDATSNDTKCEGLHGPQFPFIAYDNLIYIFFQIFLVYFCFNSIFHENTIQVLTISAVNFGWAIYGIIQAIEIHVALSAVAALAACKGKSSFDSQPWKNDVPCVLVLFFFAFIMAYLSYKLYQSFGWNIYKKIGGDVKIQEIYKNQLIFIMLLKLNLFFFFLLSIPLLLVYFLDWESDFWFLYCHAATTFFVILLEIIAYRSVARESRRGMKIFLVLWLLVIVDLGIIIFGSVKYFIEVQTVWYFLIFLLLLVMTTTILVLIYGIKILRKFGSGLKELLQKKSDKPFSGIRPVFISTNAQSTGLLEKNRRAIDEDDDD